jgi:hypothetical protein
MAILFLVQSWHPNTVSVELKFTVRAVQQIGGNWRSSRMELHGAVIPDVMLSTTRVRQRLQGYRLSVSAIRCFARWFRNCFRSFAEGGRSFDGNHRLRGLSNRTSGGTCRFMQPSAVTVAPTCDWLRALNGWHTAAQTTIHLNPTKSLLGQSSNVDTRLPVAINQPSNPTAECTLGQPAC